MEEPRRGTGSRYHIVSPCERLVDVEVAKRAGHVPVQPVVDLVNVEPVEAGKDSNLISRLWRGGRRVRPQSGWHKNKNRKQLPLRTST